MRAAESISSLTTFRRCPREYYFGYILRRKGKSKSKALRFGTLFHLALNAWWTCAGDSTEKLESALCAIASQDAECDPFELAKSRALIIGYTARWSLDRWETIGVEVKFRLPILGTGRMIRGSIDAIATQDTTLHNVEHKTTSSDISYASDYWRNVITLDPQVSTYDAASRAMGHDILGTLYDVIRKPTMAPYIATPEADRKYTIPTKKAPIPRLYASQRETDETPDEYEARLIADIGANPEKYFARKTIVRLERDNAEHTRDVLGTVRLIEYSEHTRSWPRSPNACERYGRLCEYHDACSGVASIDDDSVFETKEEEGTT